MNQKQAIEAIRHFVPFKASALSGTGSSTTVGRLVAPWRDDFLVARDRNLLVYVVYSYATPIAWCDVDGAWTMPSLRYSVTTSKHQGIVRRAIHEGA